MGFRVIEKMDICPDCGKARKLKVDSSGTHRIVSAMCKCDEDAISKEREEYRLRIAKIAEAKRFQKAFGDRVINGSFSDDDGRNPKAMETARRYVERFEQNREKNPNGIIMFGSARQGKTFIAEAIAKSLHDEGYEVLFMTAMDIVQTFQFGERQSIEALRKRMSRVDLLVIDDLGANRDTEFANEVMFNVIDSRYTAGKPLIVTTNLTKEQMHHSVYEQRMYGRIMERCFAVEVEAERNVL